MRIKMNLLLALALLVFGASEARAWRSHWFLEQCPESFDAKASKLASDLRQAEPGSPVYVPYPFPKTDHAVFADFVHQFRYGWSDRDPAQIPTPERNLYSLLEQQLIRYEVLEIAEWRPQRCGAVYGRTDSLFLLRLFHAGSGEEVARVSLQETGLLGVLQLPLAADRPFALTDSHHLESLDQAVAAARRLGLEPKQLQYVALGSPSLACYDTVPCVAFRAGRNVLLYRAGQLFELEHEKVRIDRDRFVRKTSERAAAIKELRAGEHFVSLGGRELTIARPVAGYETP